MAHKTLIDNIDASIEELENFRTNILDSGDNTLINGTLGQAVVKLIELSFDTKTDIGSPSKLQLSSIETFINSIFDERPSTVPWRQIHEVNKRLDLYDDKNICRMRKLIKLPEEFHDEFKKVLNIAMGNLIVRNNLSRDILPYTKIHRDEIKNIVKLIPNFSRTLKSAVNSFRLIFLGNQIHLANTTQDINSEKISSLYLCMERILKDLSELSTIPDVLDSPSLGYYFGTRKEGRILEIELWDWIEEIMLYLKMKTPVKLRLSREAGITKFMEICLAEIYPEITSKQIYDKAIKVREKLGSKNQ